MKPMGTSHLSFTKKKHTSLQTCPCEGVNFKEGLTLANYEKESIPEIKDLGSRSRKKDLQVGQKITIRSRKGEAAHGTGFRSKQNGGTSRRKKRIRRNGRKLTTGAGPRAPVHLSWFKKGVRIQKTTNCTERHSINKSQTKDI